MSNAVIGQVKWFDKKRGWGFIQYEGKDYFCHYNEILETGFKYIENDEVVEFKPTKKPSGWVACDIRPVATDEVRAPLNCS